MLTRLDSSPYRPRWRRLERHDFRDWTILSEDEMSDIKCDDCDQILTPQLESALRLVLGIPARATTDGFRCGCTDWTILLRATLWDPITYLGDVTTIESNE